MGETKTVIENPPAFPQNMYSVNSVHGMTLRDYFAAKHMQGIILAYTNEVDSAFIQICCKQAYEIADAMLKQRSQP